MNLIATLLFIALSPGLLLTIPAVGKKVFMSGKTSIAAILVHAVLFYLLLTYHKSIPILNMIEGFQGGQAPPQLTKVAIGGVGSIRGDCQESLRCVNGICKKDVGQGSSCDTNYICGGGTTCLEGICKKNVGLNSTCDAINICSGNTFCMNGICKQSANVGEFCDVSKQCISRFVCDNSTCKVKVNDTCGNGKMCATGLTCKKSNGVVVTGKENGTCKA